MAIETDVERSIFFGADDFGVAATYTPAGGVAKSVNGIFDNNHAPVDVGGQVPFSVSAPQFHCRTSDITGVENGDSLVVSGVSYIIRDIMPDGTGLTILDLEKQ